MAFKLDELRAELKRVAEGRRAKDEADATVTLELRLVVPPGWTAERTLESVAFRLGTNSDTELARVVGWSESLKQPTPEGESAVPASS